VIDTFSRNTFIRHEVDTGALKVLYSERLKDCQRRRHA
jgi:hypothetical protein